jgi:hypothetical protein
MTRLADFFGDDLEETLDSLKSAPGAFGNIFVAAVRQIRLFDLLLFALVVAGWAWIVGGFVIAGEHSLAILGLAVLPTALWLIAGIVAGFIFHVGVIGPRSLGFWESYVLIGVFAVFGVVSLRLALDPRERRVYHATPTGTRP